MEGEEQLGIEERNERLEGGWDGEKKGRVLREWKKGDAVVVWSRAAIRSELWSGLVLSGGFCGGLWFICLPEFGFHDRLILYGFGFVATSYGF